MGKGMNGEPKLSKGAAHSSLEIKPQEGHELREKVLRALFFGAGLGLGLGLGGILARIDAAFSLETAGELFKWITAP